MRLSVLIVNYNGRHFFDACLQSIARCAPFEHEVIVVDNASSDGSAEYLRENYPDVQLIESATNSGFAKGNNLGAQHAKGKYLLLLNNDTTLLGNISPALDLLDGDMSIGILGIRMLGREFEYRYSAGHFPVPWRLVKFSSLHQKTGGFRLGKFSEEITAYPVDWVEGSFLLTPIDLWKELKGLDEEYFMYVEDVDYARRVVDAGRRVVYCPQMSYVHLGGYGQSRIGMLVDGFRRYHRQHSNWASRVIANLVLDVGLILRALIYSVRSLRQKSDREKVLSCFRALQRCR